MFLGGHFLGNIIVFSNDSTGCILFICSYAVAIVIYATTGLDSLYFVFNFHCRNSYGTRYSQLDFLYCQSVLTYSV